MFTLLCNIIMVVLIPGAVIHTGGLIFLGFWLCHLCHLFFSLAFPFRAQQLMKSDCIWRFSHLTEVVVVIACGFVPSIAILSTSGYSFTGFPPTCNVSDTAVLFYTFTLPYALASTFGLCILLASLWILHKVCFMTFLLSYFVLELTLSFTIIM